MTGRNVDVFFNILFFLTFALKYFPLIEKSSRSHQDGNVVVRPLYTQKRNKQAGFQGFVFSMTEVVVILNKFRS